MKPVAFDYIRADDEGEALDALKLSGSDAAVMAGGMSLGPMLNMRLVRPSVVVDISRLARLGTIEETGEGVRIGATARQADVLADANVLQMMPLLAAALPHVGHYQTRSRGTFGGSVAHADPSAEIPLVLVTLGGAIELTSASGRRQVSAADFFKGILATARRPDELVTATIWPGRVPSARYAFAEFAQRHGDFAVAAAACAAEVKVGRLHHLRLGLGGVEDRPILIDVSGFSGADVTGDLSAAIAEHAGEVVRPLDDMSASADYRRALAVTLARQVLDEALTEARA